MKVLDTGKANGRNVLALPQAWMVRTHHQRPLMGANPKGVLWRGQPPKAPERLGVMTRAVWLFGDIP